MKKSVKRLLAAVLALALLGTAAMAAVVKSADTAVMYNGATGRIEFENNLFNILGKAEPDLFNFMKNMMPGDSAVQTVVVGAKNLGWDTVNLYLRVETTGDEQAAAAYEQLLSAKNGEGKNWVTLTVKQGDKVLAEGDLKNGVLLGSFSANEKTELTVTLDIDIEAGNELQGLTAAVDWVFTAEVVPYVPSYVPTVPAAPTPEFSWLASEHVNYIVGYTDGTVRPEGELARSEAAAIFYRLLSDEAREIYWCAENRYPDVSGDDWFNVAVSTLTRAGILEGCEDGLFHPERMVSRAELATILSRFDAAFGTLTDTEQFPDVQGHWAQAYIAHAAARSWVLGYPDGTFRPNQKISRAEAVTMINRILKRAVDQSGLTGQYVDWKDNYENSWYYFDMLEAGNCHTHLYSGRVVENQDRQYENWTALVEPVDWAAMEQEWIRIYGG